MSIYRGAYWARQLEALRDEFRRVAAAVGEVDFSGSDEGVPGRSPIAGSSYRDGSAAPCRGFCARINPRARRCLADLAAFEWAEVEALLAADPPEPHDRVRRAELRVPGLHVRDGASVAGPRVHDRSAHRLGGAPARPLSPSGGAAFPSKAAGSSPTSTTPRPQPSPAPLWPRCASRSAARPDAADAPRRSFSVGFLAAGSVASFRLSGSRPRDSCRWR